MNNISVTPLGMATIKAVVKYDAIIVSKEKVSFQAKGKEVGYIELPFAWDRGEVTLTIADIIGKFYVSTKDA